MPLFALVFGFWLLPQADALTCHECIPGASGSCSETVKECSTGDQRCAAVRVQSYAGGSELVNIQAKSCALAQECVEGSVNFGIAKTVVTTKCCNSDRCNNQPAPDASKSTPNGKKCFGCNGDKCTNTVNCERSEDHCIKTTMTVGGNKVTVKGCASKLICTAASNPLLSGIIGAEINCCQGDFCNSATSASTGMLLMVVPLISLVLFS